MKNTPLSIHITDNGDTFSLESFLPESIKEKIHEKLSVFEKLKISFFQAKSDARYSALKKMDEETVTSPAITFMHTLCLQKEAQVYKELCETTGPLHQRIGELTAIINDFDAQSNKTSESSPQSAVPTSLDDKIKSLPERYLQEERAAARKTAEKQQKERLSKIVEELSTLEQYLVEIEAVVQQYCETLEKHFLQHMIFYYRKYYQFCSEKDKLPKNPFFKIDSEAYQLYLDYYVKKETPKEEDEA